MIRIALSAEAFEAAARTLPIVGVEQAINAGGQRFVWLDRAVVDRLEALRGPGEDWSDVILRLVEETSATSCERNVM